jgi:hypothetical protein
MTLWQEIAQDMFRMWFLAEQDLMSSSSQCVPEGLVLCVCQCGFVVWVCVLLAATMGKCSGLSPFPFSSSILFGLRA